STNHSPPTTGPPRLRQCFLLPLPSCSAALGGNGLEAARCQLEIKRRSRLPESGSRTQLMRCSHRRRNGLAALFPLSASLQLCTRQAAASLLGLVADEIRHYLIAT